MEKIAKYFDYYSKMKVDREEIFSFFSEETMLLAEDFYRGVGLSPDNVYFKVLAELRRLEDDFTNNKYQIAHLNYLLGYYVGLFLHPVNGNEIAVAYIDKAISIECDPIKVSKYNEVKDLILEKM